jgi:hypothetical protein
MHGDRFNITIGIKIKEKHTAFVQKNKAATGHAWAYKLFLVSHYSTQYLTT